MLISRIKYFFTNFEFFISEPFKKGVEIINFIFDEFYLLLPKHIGYQE